MGTRSRIGYELPDHSVVSVYCHYDGYPENNGKVLVEHYQNRQDVQELIDGGSMSLLRTITTWNSKLMKDENGNYIKNEDGTHKYSNTRDPQPLYHSERGDGEKPWHSSFDDFSWGSSGEEYAYLYDLNGNWKAYKTGTAIPAERVEIPGYVTA